MTDFLNGCECSRSVDLEHSHPYGLIYNGREKRSCGESNQNNSNCLVKSKGNEEQKHEKYRNDY